MPDIDSQFAQLYGQFAALEHLVLALLISSPNKRAIQAAFLRQTERNAALDLYSTQPEAFLEGFAIRQKILADVLSVYIANQDAKHG